MTLAGILDTVIRERAVRAAAMPTATFSALLEAIYDARFTGVVVVHCKEGRPQLIDIPRHLRVFVDSGTESAHTTATSQ